ncbi:MAG: FAD-binding protein [Firmicutes bacterium]|nr:FAD-binding protein [Bacillota bacterium]
MPEHTGKEESHTATNGHTGENGFDVVCIGGGGAGITAAVAAAARGAKVAVIAKEPAGYGDTRISMGNMVFPGLADGDSAEGFLSDLRKSGEGLEDPLLARIMAEGAPLATAILEEYGHIFTRDEEGRLSAKVLGRTGGHSFARTVTSGPAGGVPIGQVLRAAAARAGVTVFEETVACRITTESRRVTGVVCFDLPGGTSFFVPAAAVVIATGGIGSLYYPHTDCARGATGDGFALAYEAGAELVDMEQVQFIPFAFTHPGAFLGLYCGEPALAGPAGVLRNRDGKMILEGVSRLNRAEVVRAMARELVGGGGTGYGGLLLDLGPNLALPGGRDLWRAMRDRGQLDLVRKAYGEAACRWEEPWDVAPTAHYLMGGIKVDASCESTLPGLFAAGQAMGGVHGGNRLGSVSLAELFVFGRIAGEAAAERAAERTVERAAGFDRTARPDRAGVGLNPAGLNLQSAGKGIGAPGRYSPMALQRELQKMMWEEAGIARRAAGLENALQALAGIEKKLDDLCIPPGSVYNTGVLDAIELRFMRITGRLIAVSALLRKESRGAHFRLDFPECDDRHGRKRIVLWQEEGWMRFREEGAP